MSYPYVGDARTEKQKARDKKDRGVKGHHDQPLHHTTDPHKHYQLTLKTIRAYMAVDPKLRLANRKGVQTRAKNSVDKATQGPQNRDARSWAKDLQSTYGKSR